MTSQTSALVLACINDDDIITQPHGVAFPNKSKTHAWSRLPATMIFAIANNLNRYLCFAVFLPYADQSLFFALSEKPPCSLARRMGPVSIGHSIS